MFGELVVITVVSEGGGALGKIAKIGFVLLVEKCILCGQAISHGLDVLGESGTGDSDEKKENLVNAHKLSRVPEEERGLRGISLHRNRGRDSEWRREADLFSQFGRKCLLFGNPTPPPPVWQIKALAR